MRTANTLHLIGDLHAGAISQSRRDSALADLLTVPAPAAYVQVGDLTEGALEAQDAIARAWLDSLPAPWFAAVGNHDLLAVRSGDAAAAAWGRTRNQSVDLGFAQLIILGPAAMPGGDNTTIVLEQATLDFLDDELMANAAKPCLIVCHAPLYNTVGQNGEFQSSLAPWFVVAQDIANATNGVRDQPIRDILAAHDNAKAWISGHTHNPITSPKLVMGVRCGTHTIAAINASALYYTGTTVESADPLNSLLMTLLDDRIEVRFRDHKAGLWTTGPASSKTAVVDLRQALRLVSANSQYVSLPAFDFAFPDPNVLTIEATVNLTTVTGRQGVVSFDDPGGGGAMPKLEIGGNSANGKVTIITPGKYVAQTLNPISAGNRVKVAYTRSGSGDTHRIYVDGVSQGLEPANAGTLHDPLVSFVNGNRAKAIGRRESSAPQYFGGAIQDVRVWDRALSPGEIAANLRKRFTGNEIGLLVYWSLDGHANDSGPLGRNGTLQGGATWGSPY